MAAMHREHRSVHTEALEVFREVARHGSITAAARALRFTQSTVSRQIAALESDVKAPLFDRLPRGVRLTPEGRCLLEHAEAVLDRLAQARTDVNELRGLSASRLRVGAFASANASLVPTALARLRRGEPDVVVTVSEGHTPALLEQLEAGELDACVVSGIPAPPARIDVHHLLDDPLLVALPRGHPAATRPTLRLADLHDEVWVAGAREPEDTLLAAGLDAFAAAGSRPTVAVVVADWTAKLGYVAAGLGVTLVPALAARAAPPDIVLVPVHAQDVPARPVWVAVPADATHTPTKSLLRALRHPNGAR